MNFHRLRNYLNKIMMFYFPDNAGYWNSLTLCTISDNTNQLGRYYLDFSSKAKYLGKFSKQGIPLFTYKSESDIEHPTVVAQYAFGLYEILVKNNFNDKKILNEFIKMAEWFDTNKTDILGGKGWLINIKHPEYDLDRPWISSMTQGEAISVLARASLIAKNKKYEQLAIEALAPFEYSVSDGGLINYFNSIKVYEEFPTPKKPMVVLNGFIFSLFGLYDLFLLNKNSLAHKLFVEGIESLKKLLPFFDLGNWTQYYLFDYPKKYYSSFTYHILVTEQLKALYYLTGDDSFKKYYNKWNNYSKSFFNRTNALIQKLIFSNKVIH